jgi:type IV pilus assembly protein PilM
VVEKLAAEVSLCIRYHNVTFRGQALKRLVLGGGEASPALLEVFSSRLDLKCELGDPWRTFEPVAIAGRRCQWDVAVGLALRPVVRTARSGGRVETCK